MGSCRTEVHQNESSYRRCITDLDTNTVVEEDYSNGVGAVLNSAGAFHHLNLNQHINGYLPRKRPLSPFFIEHLGVAQHDILDDGMSSGGVDSSGNNMFSLMTLNRSPKRVKL